MNRVDPHDESAFDRWFEVLHATDLERWPDGPGWQRAERLALARDTDGPEEHRLYVAEEGGTVLGVADLEFFRRENLHVGRVEIRVPRQHQRQGVGSALLAEVEREARSAGRSEVGGMDESPVGTNYGESAAGFARHHGFSAAQPMARRRVAIPLSPETLAAFMADPRSTPSGYSLVTFSDRWPDEWIEDRCEMGRQMSNDVPVGDQELDEEVWDSDRIRQNEAAMEAQNRTKVTTVAQHDVSGRLVAYSDVVIPRGAPESSWQHDTFVMGEHRGHGLGFAVKLANMKAVSAQFPPMRYISTWNAAENEHMIAINEEMGFELISTSIYWLKKLSET